MNWIAPGIETNIAYGTCMLLFGLLVLFVRNRKTAAGPQYSIYTPPLRSTLKASPKIKSMQSLRRAPAPLLSSGLLMNTVPKAVINYMPKTVTPEVSVKQLAAPVEFPVPQLADEVTMNSPSFPFESLEPIALVDLSTFGATAATPPLQNNNGSAPLSAYGLIELQEPRVEEFSVEPNTYLVDESVSEPFLLEFSTGTEQRAAEELEMFPQAHQMEAPAEQVAPTNVLSFYGLNQQPFDVTPDPSYLYLSSSHREALASLKQGIEHFRGFMLMVAEPGMGKTTVLHKLMEELAESARVIFLFQTQCSSRELLCFILNELEVDHTGMDVVSMHRALNQALLEEMLRGRRFVLIVDEAQNLQEPVLETIRLLSDFETTHSKLIQIVLAGQPQLAETLMRDSLVQLRQRIAGLSNLKALSAAETAEYVDHRLHAAGWNGEQLFTSEALQRIAESSGGVPRSINNLCFNALLESFHRGQPVVDAGIVGEVAGKLNLEALVRRPKAEVPAEEPVAEMEIADTDRFTQEVVNAFHSQGRPLVDGKPFIGPLPNPDVILTGNLTEKVRSQGWSKRHEYRILVTLERDPVSGLPIADRYYCCSMYMDEAQAAALQPGKPVRIKIEQD